MSKLIKNEIKKLFSRKVIYILLIIAIGYTILNNTLNNISYEKLQNDYQKNELSYLEEELKNLNYTTEEENSMYIDTKTEYDIIKLSLNYDVNSWQYNYINRADEIHSNLRKINENTYGLNKDEQELKRAQEQYNSILEKLNNDDWKPFIQNELDNADAEIQGYEETLKEIKDKKIIEEINSYLEAAKINKKALEWRLNKGIPYNNSFLSNKIDDYVTANQNINLLKDKENKTSEQQQVYDDAFRTANTCEYYIENNINIKNEYDARYTLMHLNESYGIFIIVFGIIIAGTIISNEFQKGTIKLLLTRPYSRNKILLSKYIVSMLCIIMFIIVFVIAQYVVGGIIFGFNTFNTSAIEYDLNTNKIVVMNVLKYSIYTILGVLPIYILISTLAFALGTITMNSGVSIAIPILGYSVSSIINYYIQKINWLKYFITANWNLSVYQFGGKGIADGLNLWISIIICFIYLLIMIITSFIVFKKRDIKNV